MNYNGNFNLSYELIRQAKYSGADIVKFQLGWRDGPGEINQLDKSKIKQLIEWSEYFGIELMFSIISEDALKLIKEFKFKKYKIASRTLKENLKLAKNIIKERKLTYVSLGMWKNKQLPFKGKKIKYLWCKSKYPTHPKDIKDLPKNFGKQNKFYGYSDHTIGVDTALIAISRGAEIVEKHFTLDKSDTTIRDHALSATPYEFKIMVNIGREIYKKIKLGV